MQEKPHRIIYKGRRYHLNRGYYKTTIALHQVIWEEANGSVPPDHHIHHKNGDSTDNRLENLECIHKKKHHSMHFSAIRQLEKMHSKESRLKALEWYRSEHGKRIQGMAGKKGWKQRKPIERICVVCGIKFLTKNFTGTKYCGQKCRSQAQLRGLNTPRKVKQNDFIPAT